MDNAIVTEKTTLTLAQIDDMRHAVGYEPIEQRRGQYIFRYYRNYYAASDTPNVDWEDLVEKGLAVGKQRNRYWYYHLTQAGFDALARIYYVEFKEGK